MVRLKDTTDPNRGSHQYNFGSYVCHGNLCFEPGGDTIEPRPNSPEEGKNPQSNYAANYSTAFDQNDNAVYGDKTKLTWHLLK